MATGEESLAEGGLGDDAWEMFVPEYHLVDPEPWSNLMPIKHQVLEVSLPESSLATTEEIWAAFLVMKTVMTLDQEVFVNVRSLGCPDSTITKELSSMFNRRRGKLHLCRQWPCHVEGCALHVTHVKVHELDAFQRDYIGPSMQRQIQKWTIEEVEEDAEEDTPVVEVAHGKRKSSMREDPRKRQSEGPEQAPAGALEKKKPTPGEEKELSEERKAELRKRLANARKRLAGETSGPGAGIVAGPPAEPESPGEDVSSSGYSGSVVEDNLITGAELGSGAPGGLKDPAETKRLKDAREKDKKKKKKKRRAIEDAGDQRKNARMALEDRRSVVTREAITGSLQDQLALRAAEAAEARALKKREKKRNKKRPGEQLLKILTDQFGKNPKKKKKKDSEGSGRKRKKRGGGSSSSSQKGSPTPSGGGSSDDSSKESSSSAARRKMDPPLKKKSKKRPGSVLQLLVGHAREQLDQAAKVNVGDMSHVDPTVGVKLASYFSIIVRPQLGQSMAQMREMHMLTQAMDLLRQGHLGLVGDVLAARFMSLHQSVLDGTWSSAKYLELLPLEDNSAAGPSVVMEARRHAKLAAKVSNPDLWGWNSGQKGKGTKGKNYQWQEGASEPKGKGKKGPKGRGKGKGNWHSQQGGDQDGDAGKKRREKVPDK